VNESSPDREAAVPCDIEIARNLGAILSKVWPPERTSAGALRNAYQSMSVF
jgi:hypothetical protein